MTVDTARIQPLLQKALNLMETAALWERSAAKKAHMAGLQGEKRRLRWLAREAQNVVDWTEHTIYDLANLDISPQLGTTDVSNLRDTMSTIKGIIDKLWLIHNEIHQIANDLVTAKCKSFAEPLYCYAKKLFCIITELRRADSEYEKASYDYQMIARYQVGLCNIHDDYERMEAAQGYRDWK